jgi:hypothetical protein
VVSLAALTAEDVAKHCERLPDVQTWTNEAAAALLPARSELGPAGWGTAVHKRIKDHIEALKTRDPKSYLNVEVEWSIDTVGSPTTYGNPESSRLDVFEELSPELICVYDIKTGASGLSSNRVKKIAERVAAGHTGAVFFVVEVRPFE